MVLVGLFLFPALLLSSISPAMAQEYIEQPISMMGICLRHRDASEILPELQKKVKAGEGVRGHTNMIFVLTKRKAYFRSLVRKLDKPRKDDEERPSSASRSPLVPPTSLCAGATDDEEE